MIKKYKINLLMYCFPQQPAHFLRNALKIGIAVSVFSFVLNCLVMLSNGTQLYLDLPAEDHETEYVFPLFSILIDLPILLMSGILSRKKIVRSKLKHFKACGGIMLGLSLFKLIILLTHSLICVSFGLWQIFQKNSCFFRICSQDREIRKKVVFLLNLYFLNVLNIAFSCWMVYLSSSFDMASKLLTKQERSERKAEIQAFEFAHRDYHGGAQSGFHSQKEKNESDMDRSRETEVEQDSQTLDQTNKEEIEVTVEI